MKRKPTQKRARPTQSGKRTAAHAEYLEAIIAIAERHPRVKAVRLGEVEISMGEDPADLPEAIGFEVPIAPESEFEPEETRAKLQRMADEVSTWPRWERGGSAARELPERPAGARKRRRDK